MDGARRERVRQFRTLISSSTPAQMFESPTEIYGCGCFKPKTFLPVLWSQVKYFYIPFLYAHLHISAYMKVSL